MYKDFISNVILPCLILDFDVCPPRCASFHELVPVSMDASTISIPTCQTTFCKRHLKRWKVIKTNLVRKWFHRELMHLTKDEEKLKDMMVILDAHSKKVMDGHYILKDPEDDVILAEALIKAVLGETVRFPTDAAIAAHLHTHPELNGLLSKIIHGEDVPEEDANIEADENEEPLDWWPSAAMFGVPEVQDVMPLAMELPVVGVLQDE